MKQIAIALKAVLLITVLASLAACSGGTFVDPGHGGMGSGSGGSGGGGKPARLSSDASYDEAADKLDEIIAYCEAHPGSANTGVKNGVEAFKITAFSFINESYWSGRTARETIDVINAFIDELQ
ncbi:MAG: hypothetical protein LBT87_09665 [Treponema sp.]|jgi:hypothetical protein|nr:hypothetical protein [Treponema sp.]